MSAIFKREFRSYFTSPLGYVFLGIFFFFEGLFFYFLSYRYGLPGMDYLTEYYMPIVIMLVTPVLTMRLLSEDRRQKVDQALLTAPVGVGSIVLGKFLAALSVYAIAFAPTFVFEMIVSSKISVNWLYYFNALFGLLLLGAALIAIGMFISSLTESSVIAVFLTLAAFLLLMILPMLVGLLNIGWLTSVAENLAVFSRLTNFNDGFFHIADVIYLLSFSCVFTFLSVRAVERRRWA